MARLFVSREVARIGPPQALSPGPGRVDRIVVRSPRDPNTAVASTQSGGRARVLRTSHRRRVLGRSDRQPAGWRRVRGVTFDRASNAVYAATDRGVYLAMRIRALVSWTLLREGAADGRGARRRRQSALRSE